MMQTVEITNNMGKLNSLCSRQAELLKNMNYLYIWKWEHVSINEYYIEEIITKHINCLEHYYS